MKIILYGHRGWIGKQFIEILEKQHINYVLGKKRTEEQDLEEEILESKCTHVLSTIGRTRGVYNGKQYTTIDYLEQPGKIVDNIRDNLYGPLCLVNITKKHNLHLTYLGTGCIFEYDKAHTLQNSIGFTEESKPNFFGSSYSIVKGFTDQLMKQYNNVLNLRIRMPITGEPNPRNFITKITTYEKICSISNSMTVLDSLLPIAVDMITKSLTGTVNLTNPGSISHNEILQLYKDIVDPYFTWKNFSIEEQAKILASARSNNLLDTTYLESLYNIEPIYDAVKQALYTYKSFVI